MPHNAVDLEQREGRINRFRNHAIRKNVAARHREAALVAGEPDPWHAAFVEAQAERPQGMSDLWPSWVYPGEAAVESVTPVLPFSREEDQIIRLEQDRSLYLLAFGQPRQESLMEFVRGAETAIEPISLQVPIVSNQL